MPILYLGAVFLLAVLIAIVCVLYCLVRNASRLDRTRSDKEQETFLEHYKP